MSTSNWEERFDKQFVTESEVTGERWIAVDEGRADLSEVYEFISTLLREQIEDIEKKVGEIAFDLESEDQVPGLNMDEIQSILQDAKDKI